jgi:class 3 adenylate cyclase
MPSLSGIDLYRKVGVNTMAIFTTAHSEYAVDGFNLNAIDFLLKPFTLERFMQAARKAKEHAMNLHNGADKDAPASEVEKSNELQKAFELLGQEKKRSEELLLNILPEDISSELKEYGKTKARSFEMVTVLFMDIKGFTKISEQYTPEEIVNSLDEYFEMFDLIVEKHGIEKIKTIGDAYLCVSGITLPIRDHAEKMIHAAKDFIMAVKALKEERTITNKPVFDFRVGIHSGPVVAGVVGIKKFAYDIWGDTVNTASRMQSNGEPGRINISHSTYELVNEKFLCEYRGEIEAKNKGKLKMYFVK